MKGILMKPDMIQATIEGRKTVTRRVIAPQPPEGASIWRIENGNTGEGYFSVRRCSPWYTIKPRYHVGETVYIKEAWAVIKLIDNVKPRDIKPHNYRPIWYQDSPVYSQLSPWPEGNRGRWRSPLFMPAWAARHFIFIEAVRAERLQEISPGDCVAEGIIEEYGDGLVLRDKYETLWNSINPKHPWDSNSWVWRYQFRLES